MKVMYWYHNTAFSMEPYFVCLDFPNLLRVHPSNLMPLRPSQVGGAHSSGLPSGTPRCKVILYYIIYALLSAEINYHTTHMT